MATERRNQPACDNYVVDEGPHDGCSPPQWHHCPNKPTWLIQYEEYTGDYTDEQNQKHEERFRQTLLCCEYHRDQFHDTDPNNLIWIYETELPK